jgi:16S rRNA C967 or C1407 C5-methylase (RsmB/RsmF family)
MQDLLGAAYADFVQALGQDVPVSLHWNPLKKIKREENLEGVKWNADGVYLPERPVFTLDPAFHAGAYYVQEASSMFVAEAVRQLAPADRPLRVLDLCAAPGGKSTLLTSVLPPGSWLLANEVIKARYPTLRYNLAKWGHPNTFSSNHDSEDFLPLAGYFDVVLVDAPCSGEGLFRKDPAAVAEWSPEQVTTCALRQRRILHNACQLVAPDGLLLYSTCTYNTEENDSNAAWIDSRADFAYQPLSLPADWHIAERQPGYQCYPHQVRGEGFYLACFRRTRAVTTFPSQKAPPFARLKRLKGQALDQALQWVEPGPDATYWETAQGNWRQLDAPLLPDAQRLSQVLKRLVVTHPLGTPKGKQLVPAPEWALHTRCRQDLARQEVDRATALELLRKQTPPLPPGTPRGWVLITYQGLGLLWIKHLGNRYNNYLPPAWRIRMEDA